MGGNLPNPVFLIKGSERTNTRDSCFILLKGQSRELFLALKRLIYPYQSDSYRMQGVSGDVELAFSYLGVSSHIGVSCSPTKAKRIKTPLRNMVL